MQRIGDGLIVITHHEMEAVYRILMTSPADVVLINHELSKSMAMFM